MNTPYIICIDDQKSVLDTLAQNLSLLRDYYNIECCESAVEALELIETLDAEGAAIALIISDQRMPEQTGIECLTTIQQDQRFRLTKKILLTGQATHQDTINAINQARIDEYIEKPWQPEILIKIVQRLMTEYLFDKGIFEEYYRPVADNSILLKRLRDM